MPLLPLLPLLPLVARLNGATGAELRINSTDEFIKFKSSVNNGSNYTGTTVFLNSDIDFTGKTFEPISNFSNCFLGTFDGQGHGISNINMNSSSKYAGLFGFSRGLIIKNVILDSSCSISSTFNGSDLVYTGGIIGECYAFSEPCTIENSVNMASVSFSGDTRSYYLYLGGIAGYLNSWDSNFFVKNCVNYGDITNSGTSRYSYIGGVVGGFHGDSSNKRGYIYNCLNLGLITYIGTTKYDLYLGGIAGYTCYTTIENCVNGRKFTSGGTAENYYIGSIGGYVNSDTSINYCYYTSELSDYSKYGRGTPSSESNTLSYDSTSFELNGTVSVGSYTSNSFIDVLNAYSDYYPLREYSHWLLNKEENVVSLTINKRFSFMMGSQIILLPSLPSEGNKSFDGWYEDSRLTKPLASFEITSYTPLYGRFEEGISYTITFKTRGGSSVPSITAPFGSVIALPSDSIRGNCTFGYWESVHGDYIGLNLTVPAHNITLYAAWKCANIKTPDDFISFFKVVNNGIDSFNGTTVFLDSDIDLTEKTFEPIGNHFNYFLGVFDGQGHVISNLKMNSTTQYVGLFGYLEGLIIKNVILGSSCSITSSYSTGHAYVGGIIGYYTVSNRKCTIENSVNMGSVSFSVNTNGNLYLGGIAGRLHSFTMKNCANYGDVTDFRKSSNSYIGGLVGDSDGYIHNCLNHGTITRKGTTSSFFFVYWGDCWVH